MELSPMLYGDLDGWDGGWQEEDSRRRGSIHVYIQPIHFSAQ